MNWNDYKFLLPNKTLFLRLFAELQIHIVLDGYIVSKLSNCDNCKKKLLQCHEYLHWWSFYDKKTQKHANNTKNTIFRDVWKDPLWYIYNIYALVFFLLFLRKPETFMMCSVFCVLLWEKGRDLTQSYDKSPYTDRNVKMAKWQHKQRHKKVRLHSCCGPT